VDTEAEQRRIRHGSAPEAQNSVEAYLRGAAEHNYQRLVRESAGLLFAWERGCDYGDDMTFAWVVLLRSGQYAAISAEHDNTGWDCQSGFQVHAVTDTEAEAARFLEQEPSAAWEQARRFAQ
jgi:hypothetical protein